MTDETLKPPRAPWLIRMRLAEPQGLVVQIGLIAIVVCCAALIFANLEANITRLNLRIGFDFLSRNAGFELAQSLIPYPENATYLRAFTAALLNTVLLAAISIACATVLGLVVALMRLSRNPLLSLLALGYIEAVRNIPLLLQLFFWYFSIMGPLPLPRQSLRLFDLVFLNKRGLSLPSPVAEAGLPVFMLITVLVLAAAGYFVHRARRHRVRAGHSSPALWGGAFISIGLVFAWAAIAGSPVSWDVPQLGGFNIVGGAVVIPEFVAMSIGMTVYGSAFIAELIRGGVLTVGKGQTEAGMAVGLSRRRIYSKVIIPQVFRAVVPPLTGQYITLLKNSSLAAAIGYPDLMLIFAGTALNQTGQPLEIMGMTMLTYLLLNILISFVGNIVNRRMQLVER